MGLTTVQEIERAIGELTPQELEELSRWLDQYVHPLDARIESDLAAGRLDNAVQRALSDERQDRVRPL
jgi:hypothetical protein